MVSLEPTLIRRETQFKAQNFIRLHIHVIDGINQAFDSRWTEVAARFALQWFLKDGL